MPPTLPSGGPRSGLSSRLWAQCVPIALLAILAAATVIRLWGIDFGQPYVYHSDETTIASAAVHMVRDVDWNPQNYYYPSFLIDLHAIVVAVVHVVTADPLSARPAWLFESEAWPSQFDYLLWGRLLVMTLGVTTVGLVFAIGRRLGGSLAGLAGAALLAVMPLHVDSSRYLTTDVPMTALATATLLVSLIAIERRATPWFVLAAALAGMTASTKYNGAVVAVVPALAYLGVGRDRAEMGRLLRRRTPWLMAAAALGAFVLATPGVLLDVDGVARFTGQQIENYGSVGPAASSDSLVFHLAVLATRLGPPVSAIVLVGLSRLALRPTRTTILIVAFVVLYLVVASLPARHYERNMIPILPYLAVAGGLLVEVLVRRVRAVRIDMRPAAAILVGGLLGVAILQPVPGLIQDAHRLERVDTRTIALRWIEAHLPPRAVVVREWYTPQLDGREFRMRLWWTLGKRDLSWYRDTGVDYVVSSSTMSGRLRLDPRFPGQAALYAAIERDFEVVYRTTPEPDRPGPLITVYRVVRAP